MKAIQILKALFAVVCLTNTASASFLNGTWVLVSSTCPEKAETSFTFLENGKATFTADSANKKCVFNGRAKYILSQDYNAGIDYISFTDRAASGCGFRTIPLPDETTEFELHNQSLKISKENGEDCLGEKTISIYRKNPK